MTLLENDESHFKVVGTFVNVMERVSTGHKFMCLPFSAVEGRWWSIQASEYGVCLVSEKALGMSEFMPITALSLSWRILLRNQELAVRAACHTSLKQDLNLGLYFWKALGYSLHQLVSEPLARAHDSLVVELEVRFKTP